jgi:ribosomal protein L3 glutamine methyltransferase
MINKREIANDLATLRDLIRWGTSQFNAADLCFAQGMPQAIDEAVYLCLNALHLPPDFSADYFDCTLTMDERLKVLGFFQQRIEQRKPAAYITNEAWFCGMNFYVDERVLIPRSPIAEMISDWFSPWIDADKVENILDLCTGSGCIALACAEYFPDAHVDASDISADALAVARVNRKNHGLEDQVDLVQSDLFESIPDIHYDIIVSNPPYVAVDEVKSLPAEFTHEPGDLALSAGEQGMDIVARILASAHHYLSDCGILVLEVGYSRPALESRYPEVPFCWVDFEFGGDGVFVLSADELGRCQQYFSV